MIRMTDDRHYFRNDFTGFAENDRIPDTDTLFTNEIFIMQSSPTDSRTG